MLIETAGAVNEVFAENSNYWRLICRIESPAADSLRYFCFPPPLAGQAIKAKFWHDGFSAVCAGIPPSV